MSGNQWWHPDAFAARWPVLQKRAAVMTALRSWFARAGFVEVDTPALQI